MRHDQADHAAALAAARAVPAASPLARRARFLAAVSLLELKQFDEAFDAFTAAARTSSRDRSRPRVLNNLGVVQLRRGATVAAGGVPTYFLTRAADADPGDPDILFNLGYAYVARAQLPGRASTGCARRCAATRPTPKRTTCSARRWRRPAASVEAARETELARQLSSQLPELEKRALAEKLPVPRGLERLREDPESRVGRRGPSRRSSTARSASSGSSPPSISIAAAGCSSGRRTARR